MEGLVEGVPTYTEHGVGGRTITDMGSEHVGHTSVLHGDCLISSGLGLSQTEQHTTVGGPKTRIIAHRHVLDLEGQIVKLTDAKIAVKADQHCQKAAAC